MKLQLDSIMIYKLRPCAVDTHHLRVAYRAIEFSQTIPIFFGETCKQFQFIRWDLQTIPIYLVKLAIENLKPRVSLYWIASHHFSTAYCFIIAFMQGQPSFWRQTEKKGGGGTLLGQFY